MKLDNDNLRLAATQSGVLCFAGGMLEVIIQDERSFWLPQIVLAALGIVLVLIASLRK